MKKNKKWLAVVLAVVMALSSLSVAFTAFAAAAPEDIDAMNARLAAAVASDADLNADLKAMGEDKDQLDPWYLMTYYNVVSKALGGDKAQVESTLGFTKAMQEYTGLFKTINVNAYGGWDDTQAKLKDADKTQVTYFLLDISQTTYFGSRPPAVNTFTSGLLYQYGDFSVTSTLWNSLKALNVLPEWIVSQIDAIGKINELNIALDKGEISAEDYVEQVEAINTHPFAKAVGDALKMDTFFTDSTKEVGINDVLQVYQSKLDDAKFNIFKAELAKVDLDQMGSAAFNKAVEEAVVAYRALPESMRGNGLMKKDPDAFKKFNQAMGSYTGDKTLPNLHESFEKQVYTGNALVGNTVDSAIAAIENLLPEVLKNLIGISDLKALLEGQLTNYNVTYVLAFLSNTVNDLLGNIDLGGMKLSLTVDETVKLLAGDYPKVAAALGAKTPDVPAIYKCPLCDDFQADNKNAVAAHINDKAGEEYVLGGGPHFDAAFMGQGSMTPIEVQKPVEGQLIYKTWDEVLAAMGENPELYNWGITEGNFESFLDALLAGLRPLTTVVNVLLDIPNMIDAVDGQMVTTYGVYESVIIPLLETLGATDVMPSAQYTAQFDAAFSTTGNVDSEFKPIIMQLYDKVLVPLMENPVDYLLNNLPNIVYHLDDGCVTGSLLDVIAGLGMGLENDPIVSKITSFKSIVEMVYGLIANGDMTKELTAEQQATSDKIYTLIAELAKTGTPTAVPTAAAKAQNTIKVIADRDNMVNYLVNALPELLGIDLDFAVKGEFVKSEAPAYPHDGKMGKDVMNAMIDGLDGLISGFVNINDLINNGFCTKAMAADAIIGIYSALENIDLSALGITGLIPPSVVADAMNEDIYKDVAAALTVATDKWSDVALILRNGDTIVELADMGFKDGDRDGFINCLTAALRPLMVVASTVLVNGTLSDGTTNYGLYETLILPLFEDIGLTPAATSAEYTDNFNKLLKRNDARGAYDYLLKTVLSPILSLLDESVAAPAKTLFKVLPNIAYAINYNSDIAFLGNLLDSMGGLTGILNGLLQGIPTGTDANDEAVYGLKNFVLPEIPLNALASAGNVTEVASKAALRETYNVVKADTADAFVTTFYYLYDAINYQDNMQIIVNLIAGIDGVDPAISGMVDSILNDVFTQSKEEALCALGSLLASDVWECPNADGNTGDKTPGTGDYSIPAIAVLAIMLSAGAAVVVLRKKKVTE